MRNIGQLIFLCILLIACLALTLLTWEGGIFFGHDLVDPNGIVYQTTPLFDAFGGSALVVAWVGVCLWSIAVIASSAWRDRRREYSDPFDVSRQVTTTVQSTNGDLFRVKTVLDAFSMRRERRGFIIGLLVGVTFAAGIALFVEPHLLSGREHVLFGIHTIGLGFVLTLCASGFLWGFAKDHQ